MAKYRVQVGYQVYHVAWVDVEAANEIEARSEAMTKAGQEVLEYEPDQYDDGSSLEVLEVKQSEEADEEAKDQG